MTLESLDVYIDALHRAIACLVERYQKNPFDFLYETDLQATLFCLLVREFEGKSIPGIPMKGGYWPSAYGEGDSVRTVPVKCEYLTFDIAIIDPNSVEHFTNRADYKSRGWKNDRFWYQPICAAVELKYCQLGERERRFSKKVEHDIKKLRAYRDKNNLRQFLGISLVFLQWDRHDASVFCGGAEIFHDPSEGISEYLVTPRGAHRRFDCSANLPPNDVAQ